jgi:hypothetical protein
LTKLFFYMRSRFVDLADQSCLCVLVSRLCLLFTAIVLAVSPWTEYHCNWDRFLRGGPDLEFSVLAVALILCLVLLLSLRGSQRLFAYLASLRGLLSLPSSLPGVSRPVCSQQVATTSPGCTFHTLPLQI